MWKHLHHQNIVPLLGVTSSPVQLISEWMPNGELTEHIKRHPDTDRLGLVGPPPVMFGSMPIPVPVVWCRRRPSLSPLLQHHSR